MPFDIHGLQHGVAGLTRTAALEYRRKGIRIIAMCIGPATGANGMRPAAGATSGASGTWPHNTAATGMLSRRICLGGGPARTAGVPVPSTLGRPL